MSDSPKENLPPGTFEVPVHFVKSNFFRVVLAGGAWFGGDANGNIHMSFYNERTPIPQLVTVAVNDVGAVIGETKRESKHGVFRELEVDVVFALNDAIAFYRTLGENIKAAQAQQRAERERKKLEREQIVT